MRILLVDDQPRSSRVVAVRLRADGYAVDQVRSPDEARGAVRDVDYDGVVVSLGPDEAATLPLVRELSGPRPRPRRPVLVVGAGDDPDRRVAALEAGAHDHLVQPVNVVELSLRVRKLVLRAGAGAARVPGEEVRIGPLALHRGRREVTVRGRRVALTPTQYALFDHLLRHRGQVVATSDLLDHCWDWSRATKTNPLPVQISRLRKAFAGVARIEATRGVGYCLQVDEV